MSRLIRFLFCLTAALTAAAGPAHAATPAAPSELVAYTIKLSGVIYLGLEWTDNSGDEDAFEVQYRNGTTGSFSSLGTVASNSVSATLNNLPANLTLQFIIRANKSGAGNANSEFSNIATVVTSDFAAPFNLTAVAVSATEIRLRWEEASTIESGYAVEYREQGGTFSELGTVPANVIHPDSVGGFELGTTYEFRVRALLTGTPNQYTDYSPIVTLTPFPKPQNVTATAVPQQPKVQLSWQDANVWETGTLIDVKRIYESDDDFVNLTTLPANSTGYLAGGSILEQGGIYVFRVWALLGNDYAQPVVLTVATDGMTSRAEAPIRKGTPFSHQLTASAVGTTRTGWSVANLPPGLTFDSASGVISGTPTVGGLFQCPVTVEFANGWNQTKDLSLRVVTPPGAPVATLPLPWETLVGSSKDIPLSTIFSDPDTDSAVRMTTSKGVIDLGLFDSLTPATVANFMHYVNDGDYANSFFHRSLPGFVIQGGGFKPAGDPNSYTAVPTDPPVANEPGINNFRGTISMAKSGGSENSATCQFFVSLGNNVANLDNQNGGFTVFGRVLGSGMSVVDAIADLPTHAYTATVDGASAPSLLSNCPIDAEFPPIPMIQSMLVTVQSVEPVPTLSYSVGQNPAPSVVTADVSTSTGHLLLNAAGPGLSNITVRATDLDGSSVTATFPVLVRDSLSAWTSRQNFATGQSGASQNPDGDALTNLEEYAFMGNPNAASAADAPVGGTTGSGPVYLTLGFKLRSQALGLTCTVEGASSLAGPWQPVWTTADGFGHSQVVSSQAAADHTAVVIRDTVPIAPPGMRFLRVRVQQQ